MDLNEPLLRHVLWAPKGICGPTRTADLIGATVEEKDFDADLTAGGVLFASGKLGGIAGHRKLPIDEMWVGHRPTSRDDAPILGPTDLKGLVIAMATIETGFY